MRQQYVRKHPCPQAALWTSSAVLVSVAPDRDSLRLRSHWVSLPCSLSHNENTSRSFLPSLISFLSSSVLCYVSCSPPSLSLFPLLAFIYSRALFLLCISRIYLPTSVFLLTFSTFLPFSILLSLPFRQFYPLSIIIFFYFFPFSSFRVYYLVLYSYHILYFYFVLSFHAFPDASFSRPVFLFYLRLSLGFSTRIRTHIPNNKMRLSRSALSFLFIKTDCSIRAAPSADSRNTAANSSNAT
jgi:hypothetical protein